MLSVVWGGRGCTCTVVKLLARRGCKGEMFGKRTKGELQYASKKTCHTVVTKDRLYGALLQKNGPATPTLNAVVRSGRRYRLNAHVLKLATHVFKKRCLRTSLRTQRATTSESLQVTSHA